MTGFNDPRYFSKCFKKEFGMNQKFNQNIYSIVHSIRHKLQQTEFLRYTYLIFLTGFFFSPDNHLHRNYFYLFVIVPFLISLDSSFMRNCIRSKLFQQSILFLVLQTNLCSNFGHGKSDRP